MQPPRSPNAKQVLSKVGPPDPSHHLSVPTMGRAATMKWVLDLCADMQAVDAQAMIALPLPRQWHQLAPKVQFHLSLPRHQDRTVKRGCNHLGPLRRQHAI